MQALACNAMSDKTEGFRASHLLLTDFSSVIRNLNLFKSLITGETSYQNSTSLLIGLALRDCCPSLPVFIFNLGSNSALSLFLLNLAATYSPTPSPVQYHRPSGS